MLQQLDGVFRCATSARVYSRTVGIGVGVGVTTGVGVGVGEIVGVGVGVTTGVGVGVGLGVGVGEGAVDAFTATPLLQTRLLPRLTQVNSRFFEITTVPTFLQAAPARGALAEAMFSELDTRKIESVRTRTRRIIKV